MNRKTLKIFMDSQGDSLPSDYEGICSFGGDYEFLNPVKIEYIDLYFEALGSSTSPASAVRFKPNVLSEIYEKSIFTDLIYPDIVPDNIGGSNLDSSTFDYGRRHLSVGHNCMDFVAKSIGFNFQMNFAEVLNYPVVPGDDIYLNAHLFIGFVDEK